MRLQRLLAGLFWAALSGSSPLNAAFDHARQDLLGARSAGQAGADVAGGRSVEALIGNPAALPEQVDWSLGAYGASTLLSGQGAAGLATTLDADLRLGLLYDAYTERFSGSQEQTLAGALALELSPGWTAGLRGKFHRLDAPALGGSVLGGSLDAGLLVDSLRLPGLAGHWSLGLNIDHLIGAWPDEAWGRAVPGNARLGLGYSPWRHLYLGIEAGWSSAPQVASGTENAWRAGVQWQTDSGWALRTGWRSDLGEQASLGFGVPLGPASLDYAALYATQKSTLTHRVGLSWAFTGSPESRLRVAPVQWLSDPESGQVQQARFRANIDARLNASAWRLELKNSEGVLLRTLKPEAADSREVDWDGLDEQGQPVLGAKMLLVLLVEGQDKQYRHQSELALDSAEKKAEAVAARPQPKDSAVSLSPPQVRPAFEAGKGLRLSHAQLTLAVDEVPAASSWRVILNDKKGKPLRVLEGEGIPPTELVWDAKDTQGARVEEALGVTVLLEVLDPSGRRRSIAEPLFTQKAYEMARLEARQRPELRLASLGLPLLSGQSSWMYSEASLPALFTAAEKRLGGFETRLRGEEKEGRRKRFVREIDPKTFEMDLFDEGGDALRADRSDLLDFVDARVRSDPAQTLWIYGLAAGAEKGAEDLARRRAVALAGHLKKLGNYGVRVVLEQSTVGASKGVRLEFHNESDLKARYVLDAPKEGLDRSVSKAGSPASQGALARWGWEKAKDGDQGADWCPATGKLAFFRDGWVWVTDEQAKTVKSLWFEPDLQAAGRLRWSDDGRQLWIRADGWRRWMSLDVQTN